MSDMRLNEILTIKPVKNTVNTERNVKTDQNCISLKNKKHDTTLMISKILHIRFESCIINQHLEIKVFGWQT